MKFSHVRAFKAVFELGTVTGAANYLHVTQPAVSHLITALEQDLGFRLFDRIKGRLSPTPEGHAFYAEVDKLFAGLESLQKRGHAIRDQATVGLTIAAMPLLSNYFIPLVVSSLRQGGHAVTPLRIMTYRSDEVADRVAMQTCDIGFSMQAPDSVDVRCIRLVCQNMCLVPRPFWKSGQRHQLTLAQIRQLPLIRHEKDPAQKTLDSLLAVQGEALAGAVEVSFASTIAAMVAMGDGAAVTDPFTAQLATRLNASVVAATIQADLPFAFYLLLPQRRSLSQRTLEFLVAFDAACTHSGIALQAQPMAGGVPQGEEHVTYPSIAQALDADRTTPPIR